MENQVTKKGTMKCVSHTPAAKIENVSINSPAAVPFDMKPLQRISEVLGEGFKRDIGDSTTEITDAVEDLGAIISKEIDSHASTIVDQIKSVEEHLEYMARHATVSIDECANMLREVANVLAVINQQIGNSAALMQKSIKELNLKAELPISQVTVGMPKALAWAIVLPPIMFGIVIWVLLKFTST